MVKLDQRLSTVFSLCDKCDVFADIGSDHGKLPVALLQSGIINRALITDINSKPLENSEKCALRENVAEKCGFFLGDGLSAIEGFSPQGIALCGMGGRLMADILERGREIAVKAEYIILQPMKAHEELLEYLDLNGYEILCERITADKHLFYHIYKAAYKNLPARKRDYYERLFSEKLICAFDPIMRRYLEYRLEVARKISDNVRNGSSRENGETSGELVRQIEKRLVRYENRFDN
ncbi:MAG: SAM-dependent methyltransferase [Eubacteriaceae bacterium]|nr:SAM-dependent methyltransferase [Eubacteriaceae bacterium]